MRYDLFVLLIRLAFHVLLRGPAVDGPVAQSTHDLAANEESLMQVGDDEKFLDQSHPHRGAGLIVPHAPLT